MGNISDGAKDFARNLPLDQAIQIALADINSRLQESTGLSCEQVGLPAPTIVLNTAQIDSMDDASFAIQNLLIFSNKQREIVENVSANVQNHYNAGPNVYYSGTSL